MTLRCRRHFLCSTAWQGVVLCGILNKKILGTSANGLIHILMNDIGPDGARSFIDQVQRVVNHWLLQRGFSVGIADTIAKQETMQQIAATIIKAKEAVTAMLVKAQARHALIPQAHDGLPLLLLLSLFRSFLVVIPCFLLSDVVCMHMQSGNFKKQAGSTMQQAFEGGVNGLLQQAREDVRSIPIVLCIRECHGPSICRELPFD